MMIIFSFIIIILFSFISLFIEIYFILKKYLINANNGDSNVKSK